MENIWKYNEADLPTAPPHHRRGRGGALPLRGGGAGLRAYLGLVVCKCVCICTYIYICVYMYVYLCVHIYIYIYICIYLFIYIHWYVYAYIYIFVYYTYVYICSVFDSNHPSNCRFPVDHGIALVLGNALSPRPLPLLSFPPRPPWVGSWKAQKAGRTIILITR